MGLLASRSTLKLKGQGTPFRPWSLPLTCLAWEALPVAYATASIALWIIWPHKTHHCAKVGIPSGGFYYTGLKNSNTLCFSLQVLHYWLLELQQENLVKWTEICIAFCFMLQNRVFLSDTVTGDGRRFEGVKNNRGIASASTRATCTCNRHNKCVCATPGKRKFCSRLNPW
jgi:hypothetical protein